MQRIAKTRGVRGAASWCALAAFIYLFLRSLLELLADTLLGLAVEGATLANPVGFPAPAAEFLSILVTIASVLLPIWWLLRATRLQPVDLRLLLPMPWSPDFCIPVFLGVANGANLLGGLLGRAIGTAGGVTSLPSGGGALALRFISLCVLPALLEELLFRGALQGLMRPSGSAAAIFGPALLFALLHLDLAQGLTAFVCGIFLGWLAERTGSILPGMLLHFINNCLAFVSIYLQLYAPANVALAFKLLVLVAFPLMGLVALWRAWQQGFRFSAGLRPGVDATKVFTSPAYTVAVLFLAGCCLYFERMG